MSRWASYPVTLRQLQYVLAVAEHRSFRRAAEACGVAQPSLSAQVAQLEDALGVQIFERLPRNVLVTPAGLPVVERARRVLLEADDLVAAASRTQDPFAGIARVGVIPTVAPYLLPEIAPALRAAYPGLRLVWVEEKTHDIVRLVGSGELDAGIVALESDLGNLERTPLGRDPFLLAVPLSHPLAKRRGPARSEDLDGETVLLLDDGHCFRDQALSLCQRAGADEASVRATSLSTLAQMVTGGGGITLLPSIAVAAENRARGLSVRAFGARGPARTLVLVWRSTSAAVKLLFAMAKVIGPIVGRVARDAEKNAGKKVGRAIG